MYTEQQIDQVKEWTADELFNALIGMSIIAPDEQFEDWMHDRAEMIRLVQENMIEEGVDE